MVTLTLPDGKTIQLPKGSTGQQAAEAIGKKLAKDALAIKVNGDVRDLNRPIEKNANIHILTFADEEGKHVFWHSTAHILTHAIQRRYPDALPTIGPATDNGFFYDFDNLDITPDDFRKIEEEMHNIINENHPFERKEWTLADVRKLKNKYKVELAKEAQQEGEQLTAYKDGDFIDLCEGPHVPSTGRVKAIKLLRLSSAYWKGDQKNKQLTRIYGIGFPKAKQLQEWQQLQEEIEKRDHRKIGQQLGLFVFNELSPGSPFLLPKGATIYTTLQIFIREEYRKRDYHEVITPQLFNKELWEHSGHWKHFKENMFVLDVDGQPYALKPMNCPSHVLLYKTTTRSYRDLPWRIADFCMLHRNELSGTLGGLTRVRKFSQDDAHIFCTPEQMKEEIIHALSFVKYVYEDVFRFEYQANLSTMPDKAMGDEKLWIDAEQALGEALKELKMPYQVKAGEGAFYGPKIDFDVKDALGRQWQLATVQLDFQMPRQMNADYEGKDNKKHPCVMIHRAILGSLERFIGVIIEHYAGKFPLWLSPEQVRILPVSEQHHATADKFAQELQSHGLRVTVDTDAETVSKKVRNAQLDQVNYILVYGEKEKKTGKLHVRTRDNKVFPADKKKFITDLRKEIEEKR